MNNPKKIKTCIFARTSSESTLADRQSYERQIQELKDFCNSRNWEATKVIASQVSGRRTKEERKDLQELLNGAEAGLYQKVVVSEISRLGRVSKIIRQSIDSLHEYGVSVVFKNLSGMESLDDKGEESFIVNVIIAIYSELSAEESRILSARIKSGLQFAKEHKNVRLGRPDGTTKSQEKLLKEYSKLAKDLRSGLSLHKCMKIHNVCKNTVIKVKKALITTNESLQ